MVSCAEDKSGHEKTIAQTNAVVLFIIQKPSPQRLQWTANGVDDLHHAGGYLANSNAFDFVVYKVIQSC